MREIEFRGHIAPLFADGEKPKKNKWIYGSLRSTSPEHPQIAEGSLGLWTNVKPETVGQWTGLSDIDEKRIFEGDVVEMKCSINTNLTGVVMFVNEVGCYAVYREDGYGLFVTDARFFRLLGNIFDDEKFHQRFWPVWQKGSQYLISKVKGPTR